MKRGTWLIVALVNIIIGGFFCALNNNIIIIRYPHKHLARMRTGLYQHPMRFSYWSHNVLQHEWRTIAPDEEATITAQRIISTYFIILEECGILDTRITTQSVTTDQTHKILICSLSHNPCSAECSVLDAWLIIEGLLTTLRELLPQFQKLWLLVNHQPLVHPSLTCLQPWPLEGFYATSTLSTTPLSKPQPTPARGTPAEFLLYITPTGTAYSPGRTIGDQFERGVALNCAHMLKEILLQQAPSLRVVMSPSREDITNPYHTISHAHRLGAQFYIYLSFYEAPHATTPELIVTTFQWHPTTDLWKRDIRPGEFIPVHSAHLRSVHTNKKVAEAIFHHAQTTRPFPLVAHASLAVPYAPLMGLQIPAIGFEIGIKSKEQLVHIAPALAILIERGIESIN